MMNKSFNFLQSIVSSDNDYKELFVSIDAGAVPALCTGLSGIHKALVCACLKNQMEIPATVITSTEAEADALSRDLTALGLEVLLFPVRDYRFAGIIGESREYEHKRIHTLSALADGDFDVLAHLTYISKTRAHPSPRPVRYEDHREVIDEILRTLVRKGKGLEMNTSGVDRCGDYLPPAAMLRRFRELGGEIVTIGSDAHRADRVGQYSFECCEILKDIFGHVCTFENRQPVFHKL